MCIPRMSDNRYLGHAQVGLMGPTHQVILVKGPGDGQWRLVDAAFGGNTPSHLIPLQAPIDDEFHGSIPQMPCMWVIQHALRSRTTSLPLPCR